MRIAFFTEHDSDDINAFSGTPYHLAMTLRRHFDEVYVRQLPHYSGMTDSTEDRLRKIGNVASEALSRLDVDAVVCSGNSPIPYLRTELPVTYWHDSTWSALFQGQTEEILSFEEFSSDHPDLRRWDEMALNRATLVVFVADWLIDVASAHYNVPRSKLRVVPFGANLEAPNASEIENILDGRSAKNCSLLFVGKDWRRKGLPLAVELVQRLNHLGMRANLTTIGCEPDRPDLMEASDVTHLGFLDKAKPDELERIMQCLRDSHFLIHPALFECFGYALTEANAFGLPVLGTPVTGLRTIVRDGINGRLFPAHAFVESAAAAIMEIFSDYEQAYKSMVRAAYNEYVTRFTWDVVGHQMRSIVEEMVARHA